MASRGKSRIITNSSPESLAVFPIHRGLASALMPELPEVETMCRGIQAVVGRTIVAVARPPCPRRPILVSPGPAAWRRRTVGQKIVRIDRVGKRVVLVLGDGQRMVFEPRMTGLVLLVDPPTTEHLRFQVDLSGPESPLQLLFWDRRGLGSVRLLTAEEFDATFLTGQVGPDALAIRAADFAARFARCRQAIKPALLDQKRLAGVGNLYASELLFLAGVDPATRCDQLTDLQWRAVYRALRKVLLKAIRYEGSTLGDGTYRTALNQSGGYQNHHRVYSRTGEPCPTCGTPIERIVQAQRATFFCPRCQQPPLPRQREHI
jgi:formamidopyrimidine-DNA glycosylase